jgi:hypothetical protein
MEHEVRDTYVPPCRPEQAASTLPECDPRVRQGGAALAGLSALLPHAADRPRRASLVEQADHEEDADRPTKDNAMLHTARESNGRTLEVRENRTRVRSRLRSANGHIVRLPECAMQANDECDCSGNFLSLGVTKGFCHWE